MERLDLQRPLGEVWRSELTRQLALHAVTEDFADAGTLDQAPRNIPTVDMLRTHIPGTQCPMVIYNAFVRMVIVLTHPVGAAA